MNNLDLINYEQKSPKIIPLLSADKSFMGRQLIS
jgi:hypothetical protein